MTFDLRRIPPPRDEPDLRYCLGFWLFALATIVCFAIMANFVAWPMNPPASSLLFWSRVAVLPAALWLIVICLHRAWQLIPLHAVRDFNAARQDEIKRIVTAGQVPVPVLASAFIFSGKPDENSVDALTTGSLKLTPRLRSPVDAAGISARWLEHPHKLYPGATPQADENRRHDLISWVFEQLIGQVEEAVRQLPAPERLQVSLNVAPDMQPELVKSAWQTAWHLRGLPSCEEPSIDSRLIALNALDAWSDSKPAASFHEPALLCWVQFSALLACPPEPGTAEAGVALLVAPVDTALDGMPPQALLHRPEIVCAEQDLEHALRQTLLWGNVQGPLIHAQWMSDDSEREWQDKLAVILDSEGIALPTASGPEVLFNLDASIGYAGIAQPWLAVALACHNVSATDAPQLLRLSKKESLELAVVTAPRTLAI